MPRARSPRHAESIHLETLLPPFAPVGATEHWLFQLQRLGIRPGLVGIRRLLREMGDPQLRMRSIVVAGTNGKGTTSICLAALCQAAGLRTALYTSPHLLRVGERIVVDGESISADELRELVDPYKSLIERTQSTFFESLTALALTYFAERNVDVAILEAGLGGRLDATNAVPRRGVVLTSIGLDHQELLGDTLEQIATEKLGLARAGLPFYVAPLPEPLRSFVRDSLRATGADDVDLGAGGDAVWSELAGLDLRHLAPTQLRQAAMSLACYRDLARREGWPDPDVVAAYAGLRAPGRWDRYGLTPGLHVDTAHNDQALCNVLRHWQASVPGPKVLVLAAMRDKLVDEALPLAMEVADRVIAVAPRWYRARPAPDLAQRLRDGGRPLDSPAEVEAASCVREGLERAREVALGLDAHVLLTGSNFLVAEALDRLGVDDLASSPQSRLWDQGLPLRRRAAGVLGTESA